MCVCACATNICHICLPASKFNRHTDPCLSVFICYGQKLFTVSLIQTEGNGVDGSVYLLVLLSGGQCLLKLLLGKGIDGWAVSRPNIIPLTHPWIHTVMETIIYRLSSWWGFNRGLSGDVRRPLKAKLNFQVLGCSVLPWPATPKFCICVSLFTSTGWQNRSQHNTFSA